MTNAAQGDGVTEDELLDIDESEILPFPPTSSTPMVILTEVEYDALIQERDQLRQEVANLKRMLEDLTPGGSEFHNSPARCIEFIKGKLAMEGKLMRALAKERQRINRQEAEKRELLSIVNSLGLPIEDIEVETMSLAEYEERYGGHHR